MKRFLAVLLAASVVLTACGNTGQTAGNSGGEKAEGKKNSYTMLTGSSGAQYFTFGTAMANEINNESEKITVTALTANGVSEVINMVQSNEADFGFITYDTGYIGTKRKPPSVCNISHSLDCFSSEKRVYLTSDKMYSQMLNDFS